MDSQMVTIIAIAVLVALVALSYVRTRNNKSQSSQDTQNGLGIKETIEETREYLGLSNGKKSSRVATAFDMAPAKLVSDMSKPANKLTKKRRRKN